MIAFRKLIIFSVFLLLLPAVAVSAADAPDLEPIARVVALRGQVTARDGAGKIRTIALKSPVFPEDTLTTGQRGRVQILFADNSIVSLGPATVARIADYLWQEEGKKGRMTTEVREGMFRVMGGLLSRHAPGQVITKTQSTTIGIRGSMYSGIVAGPDSEIFFEGGKGIDLSNGAGSVAVTRAGYCSRVGAWNESPSEPRRLDSQAVGRLFRGMGMGGELEPQSPGGPTTAKSGRTGGMVSFSRAEQRALYGRNLTVKVQEEPARAAEIFQEAVTSGQLEVADGLEAALLGMKKVDRPSFDRLVQEAVSLGLTGEQAGHVAERIKESGLCD